MAFFTRSALASIVLLSAAHAQDLTITEGLKSRIEEFAAETVRSRGTQPEDWRYTLPAGVTTKQVTFYSDETACYRRS